MFLVIFCGRTEASQKEEKKEQNFNWDFIYSKYVEYGFKLRNPINTTLQLMLVLPVCITESVFETDGWHMRAPRKGRADVLYWFGQGNRRKGFSRISRPLAAVVSRGSAQSTSHSNQPWTTTFGLCATATPWPQVFSWKGIMAATALPLPSCSVTIIDWLTILTPALLCGVSMFFTYLWEGKKKQLTENEEMKQNFLQMLQEKESAVKRKTPVNLKQKEPFRNVLDPLWCSVATKTSSQ